MGPLVESETRAPLTELVDSPTREDPSNIDHVLLTVPGVHAESVKLQYLSRVVFIDVTW